MEYYCLGGQQRCRHARQRRILGATDRHSAIKSVPARYSKLVHGADRLKENEERWKCEVGVKTSSRRFRGSKQIRTPKIKILWLTCVPSAKYLRLNSSNY